MTWRQLAEIAAALYVTGMGLFLWAMYRAGERREAEERARRWDEEQWPERGRTLPAGREGEEGPWRDWLR